MPKHRRVRKKVIARNTVTIDQDKVLGSGFHGSIGTDVESDDDFNAEDLEIDTEFHKKSPPKRTTLIDSIDDSIDDRPLTSAAPSSFVLFSQSIQHQSTINLLQLNDLPQRLCLAVLSNNARATFYEAGNVFFKTRDKHIDEKLFNLLIIAVSNDNLSIVQSLIELFDACGAKPAEYLNFENIYGKTALTSSLPGSMIARYLHRKNATNITSEKSSESLVSRSFTSR